MTIDAEIPSDRERASDLLLKALSERQGEMVSVGEINSALGERAFGIVMLLFALPNCIPFPPGVNSIFGMPLLFCAAQLVKGRGVPWQPQFVANRSLKRATLINGIEKVKPKLAMIEKFCCPRLTFLVSGLGERLLGLAVCLFSICIIIPLPLTNMIPAIGSALIAISLIERDGVLAIIGVLIGTIGTIITAGIVGGFIAGLKFAI
jgi:hypothetical protein